jgi:uncharacterized protein (DUF433 family)
MAVHQTAIASWIEQTPGVCGGAARIRKTRHTVAGLIQLRRLGLSDERILEHHPDLNKSDLDAAWAYYLQQPDEIEQDIRDDEEA